MSICKGCDHFIAKLAGGKHWLHYWVCAFNLPGDEKCERYKNTKPQKKRLGNDSNP